MDEFLVLCYICSSNSVFLQQFKILNFFYEWPIETYTLYSWSTQMFQKDLLLNPANFSKFVPTYHGASSQVNQLSNRFTLKQLPKKFTKQQPNFVRRKSDDNTAR